LKDKSVTIPNISCGHCVAAIQRELSELKGVKAVEGDPQTKKVTVQWEDPLTWETIAGTLVEIGYPPEP
jgi:copper chaperone CopZ